MGSRREEKVGLYSSHELTSCGPGFTWTEVVEPSPSFSTMESVTRAGLGSRAALWLQHTASSWPVCRH